MTKRKSLVLTLGLFFVSILIFVVGMEAALRLQQRLGPFYDLENLEFLRPYNKPSNLLNHMYKEETDKGRRFDVFGIHLNPKVPSYTENTWPRLLFLGDSFVAGDSDENALTQYLWKRFKSTLPDQKMNLLNAACPSYSATSYLLQAKYLLPELKPDYLIVNFDETDLSNDFNSRTRVVKGYDGKIVAHLASYKADMLKRLTDAMQKTSLYTKRLVMRLFTTQAIFPVLDDLYGVPSAGTEVERLFYVSSEKEEIAYRKYAAPIANFKLLIEELADNIKTSPFRPKAVVFSSHAHLQHFQAPEGGALWNRIIASTVRDVADAEGFLFYDGYEDMKKAFGDSPQDFYIPNDMHLNEKGLSVYANGLGQFLEAKLLNAKNEKRASSK